PVFRARTYTGQSSSRAGATAQTWCGPRNTSRRASVCDTRAPRTMPTERIALPLPIRQVFLYDKLAVTVRSWYEVNPKGDEHGARVEISLLAAQPWRGTESAAQ